MRPPRAEWTIWRSSRTRWRFSRCMNGTNRAARGRTALPLKRRQDQASQVVVHVHRLPPLPPKAAIGWCAGSLAPLARSGGASMSLAWIGSPVSVSSRRERVRTDAAVGSPMIGAHSDTSRVAAGRALPGARRAAGQAKRCGVFDPITARRVRRPRSRGQSGGVGGGQCISGETVRVDQTGEACRRGRACSRCRRTRLHCCRRGSRQPAVIGQGSRVKPDQSATASERVQERHGVRPPETTAMQGQSLRPSSGIAHRGRQRRGGLRCVDDTRCRTVSCRAKTTPQVAISGSCARRCRRERLALDASASPCAGRLRPRAAGLPCSHSFGSI